MESLKLRVGITHGDTNGIGYELIFKTFAEPDMLELCTPIVYGSPKIAAYHRKALESETGFTIIDNAYDAKVGRLNMLTCFEQDVKVDLGTPTPESGKAAKDALDRAIADLREGKIDVLVSAPISNDNMPSNDKPFGNLSLYLQDTLNTNKQELTLLLNDTVRVALTTDDMSLKDVAENITEDRITTAGTLLYETLRRDFNLSGPRIAVLALNPKGDGNEEQDILKPAIQKLRDNKVIAFGPFAADNFFGRNEYDAFDGVLAMYHDQGSIPMKTLQTDGGVIYYADLPYICTSVGEDASFSIAGQGKADERAFRHAIYAAIDIFRNRTDYDEAVAHPLQKLYHEKRDETEKVRFSIPKKHENAIRERLGGKRPSSKAPQKPQTTSSTTNTDTAKGTEENTQA